MHDGQHVHDSSCDEARYAKVESKVMLFYAEWLINNYNHFCFRDEHR